MGCDAWAFCCWLGEGFRLPTEKEWEFACRAGTQTAFHFGDSLHSNQANFDDNYPYGDVKRGPYLERTVEVGSYPANAFQLYDMHGNVWGWCESWFGDSPEESDHADFTSSARVLRGVSWSFGADFCRSACRLNGPQALSNYDAGFRVARARKS